MFQTEIFWYMIKPSVVLTTPLLGSNQQALVPALREYPTWLCCSIVDRANWLGNFAVSLLYVFVLYFFVRWP